MRVAAQMYSYVAVCVQNHVNHPCMYLFPLQAANISAGMPFNDVSPAKRIVEAVHLAIAIYN